MNRIDRTNGGDIVDDGIDPAQSRPAAVTRRINPKSAKEALQPERVPPPPGRSRAVRHPAVVFLNFVLTVMVVALAAIGGLVLYAKYQFESPGPLEEPRSIMVARGSTLGGVADLLQRHGIIGNRWVFWAGVRFNKQESALKAGEYLIPARASMAEVMETMVAGRGILYAATVPEGLTSVDIVERLRADPVLVGDISDIPPEGSLLPETYKFTRGETRQAVLDRMRRERDRVVADVWSRRVEGLPINTPEELVILASIVEKETAISDERSRVAAVFINRLDRDMRLQSDPTVIYGVYGGAGKPADKPITRSDLNTPTPYNTYQIDGLPPGPIANPGRASLEAVANPSRTADLYFVADGTGGHAFAETFEEHQRNVARWREVERRLRAERPAPAEPAPAPDAAAPDPDPALEEAPAN